MKWLDLTRVNSNLFILDIEVDVALCVSSVLFAKNVQIFIEVDENTPQRELRPLQWQKSAPIWKSAYDNFAVFRPKRHGSYKFSVKDKKQKTHLTGYLKVAPPQQFAASSIVTLMPKLMGPFSEWSGVLDQIEEWGYDAVHFTPLQKLGSSRSPYSIADQLELEPSFEVVQKELEDFLKSSHLKFVHDAVWNHTATNSEWVKKNPEIGYNLVNSSHLIPAYFIDHELRAISNELTLKTSDLHEISNEDDLNRLGGLILDRLKALSLDVFYKCDVESELARFKNSIASFLESPSPPPEKPNSLALESTWPRGEKFSRRVNFSDEVLRVGNLIKNEEVAQDEAFSNFEKTILWLNEIESDKMIEHIQSAVNGTLGTLRYERLDQNGPRKGPITPEHPICPRYFYCLEADCSPELIMQNCEKRKYVLAHNGWVMNWNPLKNFAGPDCEVYLRRELCAWDDSIKLNYGEGPEHCPVLWKRMENYTRWLARHGAAIRIDNCHSTPLHVAEFFLNCARDENKDVVVIAELFTACKEQDDEFVSRLGLDYLIREALQAHNNGDFCQTIRAFCGTPIGALESSREISKLAPGLLMDASHDNPSLYESRPIESFLTTAAIASFSSSPVGSNYFYDQLVPKHVNIVNEKRKYPIKSATNFPRKIFNDIRKEMKSAGADLINVESNEKTCVITRRNEENSREFILISGNLYDKHSPLSSTTLNLNTSLENIKVRLHSRIKSKDEDFVEDPEEINGLSADYFVEENVDLAAFSLIERRSPSSYSVNLSPGAVIVLTGQVPSDETKKLAEYASLSNPKINQEIIENLTLLELNQILFSCKKEEMSNKGNEHGVYNLPSHGEFPYAGFAGVYQYLLDQSQSVSSDWKPLAANMSEGTWLLEYLVNRIDNKELKNHLLDLIAPLLSAPKPFAPRIHLKFLQNLTESLFDECLQRMPEWMRETRFTRYSALATVAIHGNVRGATYPIDDGEEKCSMAAGLPHFAEGIWRCWGRDSLIALKGTLIETGRLEEAWEVIKAFGTTLRHGLIPNLLGEGKVSRYNCRDATWFWLHSIKDIFKAGMIDIFSRKVRLCYADDDALFDLNAGPEREIQELVQQILQRHVDGIDFIERNAGPQVDMQMKQEGFHVRTKVDRKTGFPMGGNRWNCGTWMDKMGESDLAGNRGYPSTPRDGAPVEIVGLCFAVVAWLHKMHEDGHYPYAGVKVAGAMMTWFDWANKIRNNFEKCFYVDLGSSSYYADTYQSSVPGADSQLRCNFPIALAVAPALVFPGSASTALFTAYRQLKSGLGLRTLSPDDDNYRPNYFSDDSLDASTAKGANYHNGPSWVWPLGYFLRAGERFGLNFSLDEIAAHDDHIFSSHWIGLPELQNENGAECPGSCPIQAWSTATLIDFASQLRKE